MKDTNNSLNYNLWSAGEYNNNTTGINKNNNSLITVSNNISSIGENSLRIERTSDTYPNTAYFTIANNGSNTITVSLNVYSPNNNLEIQLYDGTNVLSTTTVVASAKNNILSLSGTTDVSTLYVRFRLPNQNDYSYLDNISAIIS